MKPISIHKDIARAHTLPGSFYREPAYFDLVREKVFAHSWHYLAETEVIDQAGKVFPLRLLPGVLDEPLLLSRDHQGEMHCLSNVCTHRGKIVVERPGTARLLSCGYHGRCFDLNGRFRSMPGFEQTEDFPSTPDHLPKVSFQKWLGICWGSLFPESDFEEMTRPIRERLAFLPLDEMTFSSEPSTDYFLDAHWALYVDNYLEGFHIPFVHPALNQALAFDEYDYELYPYCNLQLGVAKEGETCFDIPEGHPDHGQNIYAYYWWLFPNIMFNFYPWGLSLNVVEPLSHQQTRIRFRSYYFPGHHYQGEDERLHQTEMEDEAIVLSVQQGIQSRFYERGRFSATMEKGVHHFHRLLASRVGLE